jgi:hypothetical protein
MLHTTNNTIRTLIIQAFMPPTYWVEALSTATVLINRLPSAETPNSTPFELLHNKPPTNHDLRIFGCFCYPNISATTAHKLSPRSIPCVFFGYPTSHKGYRYLNLVTQQLIISRHVIFNKTMFPFRFRYPDGHDRTLDFLLPSAPAPLLAREAGPSAMVVTPGHPSVLADDESLVLVTNLLHRASPSTTARASIMGAQDGLASSTPSMHGTITVHGAPYIPVATTPPAPTRHCGTPAPVAHPIAVTRDEGHTHAMVMRQAAGVTLKPANRLNLSATTSPISSPVPTDYRSALANPHWHAAM